ncbi:MAG: hypothetical protein Q7U36_04700 [bacterium]|nr:hypothetical protein [bacterium]
MKNINNGKVFSLFGLIIVSLGWLGLLLAFFSFFHTIILVLFLIFFLTFFSYLIAINRKKLKLSWDFILVIFFSLLSIVLFSYFTVPTVFSGRDQGSLSNAAINLSKNHTLKNSFPAEKEFFKIYGSGTALNFPGFNYTKNGDLIPNFSLGYIAWLAVFFSFFGIQGLIIANGVSFFLFLLSFYILAKNYIRKYSALVAFFLVITSFIFSWFFKFTLSENLALGLIWFGLSQFVLFLKEKDKLFLVSFLTSFGLLFFIRIESLAFLAVVIMILFFLQKKESLFNQKIFTRYLPGFFLLMLTAFLASLFVNKSSYITLAKGLLNSLHFFQNKSTENVPFLSENIYLLRIFSIYAILNYISFGLIGFFYFLKQKKISLLIPFFILLPAFLYLINPSITPDHPWMLRRYVFAVIPVSILYSVFFLDYFFKKRLAFYILVLVLFFSNLIVFIPYLSVKENDNLLSQIKEISSNFNQKDLILIDRNATGDPWAMMSGPMNIIFDKQAVYFFNPNDLEKIDQTKFEKIYLIIPDNGLELFKKNNLFEKLLPIKDYRIEKQSLEIFTGKKEEVYKNSVFLPTYQKSFVYGKIYLLNKD